MPDKPCRAVIVANTTADVPDVPGSGMPWLISCRTCLLHSTAVELRRHPKPCRRCDTPTRGDPPAWSGHGEAYAPDLTTARRMADNHNARGG